MEAEQPNIEQVYSQEPEEPDSETYRICLQEYQSSLETLPIYPKVNPRSEYKGETVTVDQIYDSVATFFPKYNKKTTTFDGDFLTGGDDLLTQAGFLSFEASLKASCQILYIMSTDWAYTSIVESESKKVIAVTVQNRYGSQNTKPFCLTFWARKLTARDADFAKTFRHVVMSLMMYGETQKGM